MLREHNLCLLSSKPIFSLNKTLWLSILHTGATQAVKDGRTNLTGNELILSSSHINFVRIVSQVENVGSEYGIMSYFFRLNWAKCHKWKPCHLCDWNIKWWAVCIAQQQKCPQCRWDQFDQDQCLNSSLKLCIICFVYILETRLFFSPAILIH